MDDSDFDMSDEDDRVSVLIDKRWYFARLDEGHSRWMQSEERQKSRKENFQAEYFGVCPTCHTYDHCMSIHKDEWMVCHEHRCRWMFGSNLSSAWHRQNELDWEWASNLIKEYVEVEPKIYSSPPPKRPMLVVCFDPIFCVLLRAVARVELELKRMRRWINGNPYFEEISPL